MNLATLKPYALLGQKHTKDQYQPINLSVHGAFYQNLGDQNWEDLINERIDTEETIYYGGYLEERFFYASEELFGQGSDRRKYHLGVDLWTDVGTDVFCPLDGEIISITYNSAHLDYGNTIIMKHLLADGILYSLYGHLSSHHVSRLEIGQTIGQGTTFCQIGAYEENGHWPPHLHFQLIKDLDSYTGDYPGVSSEKDLAFYKNNCPDPTTFVLP